MTLHRVRVERVAEGVFLGLDRVWVAGEDGVEKARDVIHHPGGVAVLPIDGDDVILVRQYRVAIDDLVLEIPAGKLDPTDTSPVDAARRELLEEIGATPLRLVGLGSTLVSPGYTSERIHLFVAEGILWSERQPQGLEERSAEIIRFSWQEAMDMVDAGGIVDAKTMLALILWNKVDGSTHRPAGG